jgi:hypothetical protein
LPTSNDPDQTGKERARYLNLVANPDVAVGRHGTSQTMCAPVTADEERERLWDDISAAYPVFTS